MMIRVGTAGVPLSSPERDTLSGIKFVRELGLDAMELEFVRSVYLNEEGAKKAGNTAKELDVRLSVHAPYYINLNSEEDDKLEASKERIIQSARIGEKAGAMIVVFHPGYYGKKTKEETMEAIMQQTREIRETLNKEGNKILLGPETTGKVKQFGTLEELIEVAKKVKGVQPVVDFGHMHARYNGGLRTKADFERVFDKMQASSGKPMHIHAACIEYSEKGELRHLPIEAKEPDYHHMTDILKERRIDCTIISESPNIEADALKIKKMLS